MPGIRGAPTLTDGVVALRRHTEADLERIVEQCRDPETVAWTTVPAPYARDDAARFVRHAMPGGWESDEEWGFAVEHEGRYAATVALRNHGDARAEVAYAAHPDARGTGVMERALRLACAWGFEERDLQVLLWLANVGNWASRRLAWKVGFADWSTLPGWLAHRGELRDAWQAVLPRDAPLRPRHPWLVPPVIRLPGGAGPGLLLRPEHDRDLPRIVEACAEPETWRWMRIGAPPGEASVRANTETSREEMAVGATLRWTVADADDDRLLGAVNLFGMGPAADGSAELGFWTHPEARDRGVATAAARAALRHAFVDAADGGLGLRRVSARAGVPNTASRRALEAAGMRPVGTERERYRVNGDPVDYALYDVVAREWTA